MKKISLTLITVLVVFVPLILAQNNPVCQGKRYSCIYPGKTFNVSNTTNGTDSTNTSTVDPLLICVHVNDTRDQMHLLQNCPVSTPSCPYSTATWGTDAMCEASPAANLTLPGEPCTNDTECLSGNCNSTTAACQGKEAGQTCSGDIECDVGLFCNDTGSCQTQRIIGENCTRDLQCTNGCACNLQTCVYYYTFANGLAADNSVACKSGYIENGTCAAGRTSVIKGRPCSSNADCITSDANGTLRQTGTCQCGFNGGGFTYCPLAEGDSEFQDMLSAFSFIALRNQNCHTTLRFGPCQYFYNDEYSAYMQAYLYFYNYPQLVFNDDCIKKIYTWYYWQWASAQKLFSLSFAMVAFILMILHLIV